MMIMIIIMTIVMIMGQVNFPLSPSVKQSFGFCVCVNTASCLVYGHFHVTRIVLLWAFLLTIEEKTCP